MSDVIIVGDRDWTDFRVLHAMQDTGCRLRIDVRDGVPLLAA